VCSCADLDRTVGLAIAAGRDHSLAIKADGSVVAWESKRFGQAMVPANLPRISEISVSYSQVLARIDRSIATDVAFHRNLSPLAVGQYFATLYDLNGQRVWSGSARWTGSTWQTGYRVGEAGPGFCTPGYLQASFPKLSRSSLRVGCRINP
jgi:hypothetical protein